MSDIKSEAEHAAALARLDALMAADPAPGTRESDELERLSVLVERYEDERFSLDLPLQREYRAAAQDAAFEAYAREALAVIGVLWWLLGGLDDW